MWRLVVDRQTAFERLAQCISVASQSSDGVTIHDCWRALAQEPQSLVVSCRVFQLLSAVIAQLCLSRLCGPAADSTA